VERPPKKVKRGLAGQLDRGYATGAKQYGYRTTPILDPSGRRDAHGKPEVLGFRIAVDDVQAEVIRQVFAWAADGRGLARIVAELNQRGTPNVSGKRWTKSPISRMLKNERYLGKQIRGVQSMEREPGTGRKRPRQNPRSEWQVRDRPDLRIVSDELWERAQATRGTVRAAVAPKHNLARGKDGNTTHGICFPGSQSVAPAAARSQPCPAAPGAPALVVAVLGTKGVTHVRIASRYESRSPNR
jgi:hypothetical protein